MPFLTLLLINATRYTRVFTKEVAVFDTVQNFKCTEFIFINQIHCNYVSESQFILYNGLCLLDPTWRLSCIMRRNLAFSLELVTGIGIPDPLKLILPPEDGVASLSLTLESITPSVMPPSAPRIDKDRRVGTRSLPRAPPLRPVSDRIHKSKVSIALQQNLAS